ncbi:MAG: hypothetical protein C0518_00910 [Opitutus sp.]|nr:hypothetical protein [Opitutus sp.]
MHTAYDNPYASDPLRGAIWEMCVRRDLEAFLTADWNICAGDFVDEGFVGWNAHFVSDSMKWTVGFPTLTAYRETWLSDARAFAAKVWAADTRERLYRALTLARIDFASDSILVHKRFDGALYLTDGSEQTLRWQSLFVLRRIGGRWKQAGFIGYLPFSK